MKRGKPIKRLTPLKRSTTPIKRTALKRTAVKKKSRVRDSRMQQFHNAVGARANGRCEVRIAHDCTGRYVEAHHVVTRKRGVGWPFLHDASRNGLGVCAQCHGWIHRHIKWAQMISLLLSRPSNDDDPGPILPRHNAVAESGHT